MTGARTLVVTFLLALTASCSPADVGLGARAGSPDDDTEEELVERLEATGAVQQVDDEVSVALHPSPPGDAVRPALSGPLRSGTQTRSSHGPGAS